MKNSHKLFVSASSTAILLGSMLIGNIAFAQTGQITSATGDTRGFGGGRMMARKPGVFGKVIAINGSTLTVDSTRGPNGTTATTYAVDASSATVMKDGANSTLSNIAVGDMIMAEGTVTGTNVAATSIQDGMRGGMMGRGMRPGVFGTVASIGGTTLTVTSKAGPAGGTAKTYTVDASAAKVNKDGAASTLASVAVGDTVMIDGTVTGSNIVAKTVNDGMGKGMGHGPGQMPASIIQGNGQPVVGGNVTAVNGPTLTVTNKSGMTYSVDASNATIAKNNATSSISNIAVGDNVIVQGSVNGTNITATSVMDAGVQAATPALPTSGGFNTGDQLPLSNSGGGFMGMIGGFFHKLFGFF